MTARSREFSLKTLLLLALLAVSLPPAVLAGSVVFKLAASQEATLEAGVHQRVDAIATATDRYFDSVASVLQAVSMSISLQRGDLGAFRTTAQALVHTDALAGGLALLSTTGSVLLEAPGSASTDGLEADARDAVGEVVRTGQPAVSNLYASHDLRNAAVAVAAPVFRNGALAYVLLTLVPAAELDALLRGQHLPSDWIAALVDQNGTIVARTRDADRFVGRPANAEFMSHVIGESGSFTNVNLDRVDVYGTFRKSPETGWLSAIGLPRSSLVAPVQHSLAWLIGGSVMVLLVAVGIGAWATRRIVAPVRLITAAAHTIGEGHVPVAAPTGVAELTEIGRELVKAGERRREAEAAERKTAEQLQGRQRMETVGQLAAGVAHDFNNLLMVLNGNLEMLEREPLSPRAARLVSAGLRAVTRGDKLVSQILTFGQRQMLKAEPCDIEAQLSGMFGLLQTALGPEIPIKHDFAAPGAISVVDKTEFDRAILNIAINARDAMNGPGVFRIATSLAANGANVAGPSIRVAFSDTGAGMPADVLGRAFDPFFTTKEVGHGSGLGLSQVYGFARQSEGHVALESELGQGTTVIIELPLSFRKPATITEEAPGRAEPSLIGLTVVVVDDTPDVLDVVTATLEAVGCTVLRAANGAECLAILSDHCERVAVVLTDVMMPGGMMGTELVGRIREICPNVPAVLMSGYAQHQNDNDVLRKPFSSRMLLNAVQAATRKRGERA